MDQEPLVLVDARDLEIQAIIDKVDNAAPLNKAELELLRMIKAQDLIVLSISPMPAPVGRITFFMKKDSIS